MKSVYYYELSLGKIGITEEKGAISQIFFGGNLETPDAEEKETPLIKEAAKQLEDYLAR
jgi:methylated-DNA-[protein]-cysteine S-methyltransferase